MSDLPDPCAKRICDHYRTGHCRPITPTELEEAFNEKLFGKLDRYLDTVPGSESASKLLRIKVRERDTPRDTATNSSGDTTDGGGCGLPGPL